jgi:hypothetical protein
VRRREARRHSLTVSDRSHAVGLPVPVYVCRSAVSCLLSVFVAKSRRPKVVRLVVPSEGFPQGRFLVGPNSGKAVHRMFVPLSAMASHKLADVLVYLRVAVLGSTGARHRAAALGCGTAVWHRHVQSRQAVEPRGARVPPSV